VPETLQARYPELGGISCTKGVGAAAASSGDRAFAVDRLAEPQQRDFSFEPELNAHSSSRSA
jgi:hypothetical protein